MAGETKFIKGKIQATKKTAQITKAMNMVSAWRITMRLTSMRTLTPNVVCWSSFRTWRIQRKGKLCIKKPLRKQNTRLDFAIKPSYSV